jgi:hypothetical protein
MSSNLCDATTVSSDRPASVTCHKAFISATVNFDDQERFVSAAAVLANDPVHSRTISVGMGF